MNTFHLPFWEMSITLDNVQQITGLPMTGDFMSKRFEEVDIVVCIYNALGIPKNVVCAELIKTKSNCVRIDWLRKNLQGRFDSPIVEGGE